MSSFFYYIGKISSIKNGIIICNAYEQNPYLGEILTFSSFEGSTDSFYEGVLFEISSTSLKILLVKGSQQFLSIGTSIYGTSATLKIRVGFSILSKTINHLNSEKYKEFELLNRLFETVFPIIYRVECLLIFLLNVV